MTSVRDRVNIMLFGGQHDAIIQWVERLEKELQYIKLEGELMSDNNNVVMEGVISIFRNFAGKESDFNREGDRNFCVLLDEENAKIMAEDGWNVKWLKPREDADEGPEPEQAYIQIKLKYDKGRPPKVVLITSRGKTNLGEDEVEMLDWADIKNIDLIMRPYHWNVNTKTGISAYLQSLYVTIDEDELERKYADMEAQ